MPGHRKTAIVQESTELPRSPEDVIAEAISGIVKFNQQLITANAHKDQLLMQAVVANHQQMVEFWKTENERLRGHIERKELEEKLRDRSAEREELARDKAANRELRETIVGDFSTLLPKVVNKMIGAPALTEKEKNILLPFLLTLSDAQREAMSTMLTPAQRIAFLEMISAALPPDDEEEKPPDTARSGSVTNGGNSANH